MHARPSPRIAPTSGRYFHVDLAAALEQAADERIAKRAEEAGRARAKADAEPDPDKAAALREAADQVEAKAKAWADSARARAEERRAAGTAVHAFRVPGAGDVAGVFRALQRPCESDDLGDIAQHNIAKCGMQIGTCWWHASQDLEATRAVGEDRLAYGARVNEELVDAGYIGIEIIALAKACGARIGDAFIAESEVADRAGFSVPTTGCWT